MRGLRSGAGGWRDDASLHALAYVDLAKVLLQPDDHQLTCQTSLRRSDLPTTRCHLQQFPLVCLAAGHALGAQHAQVALAERSAQSVEVSAGWQRQGQGDEAGIAVGTSVLQAAVAESGQWLLCLVRRYRMPSGWRMVQQPLS